MHNIQSIWFHNWCTGISIRLCSNPSPWRLDMVGSAVDPEAVLMQHGGITDKNFAKIINEGSDDNEIELISHSPYCLQSCLPTHLANGDKSFSVLSLNAHSILAKFTGLQVMLELFASQNIHFHAICIKESWIHNDSKLPLIALEGYQCFSIKATSSHGGLIRYLDDEYDVQVKKTVDDSNIWKKLFLELNHSSFQNKIIIGNVYKPPRDNNSARKINPFKSETEPILQEIGISNNEALICGDYNINLLKINGEAHFSEFCDTMLEHSFYPKITLPTRLNRTSGATLINNIYCELSSQTLTTSAGIILDELSDHYPYFLGIDNLNIKQTKPPQCVKQKINNIRAMENLRDMLDSNITNKLNCDLLADSNENYNILHRHMKSLKDKHMPEKYIKFHKHCHKKLTGYHMGYYVQLSSETICTWSISIVHRIQ